ncbi:MAG: hypothetical protein K2X27_20300 [Candidatus Obscuribacterales bacterium]|nr:hypothetical protein [Candidatus Obscuribacterales bacterium]
MLKPRSSPYIALSVAVSGLLYTGIDRVMADEVIESRRTTIIESAPLESARTTTITTTYEPLKQSDVETILKTIEIRRAEILNRIANAESFGSLSKDQALEFKSGLEKIGTEISILKSQTSPSPLLAITLAQDLDSIAMQARTAQSTIVYVPIIEGSHFTIFNGRIIQLDDIAVRRIGLESKILDRQAAGQISRQEADELRHELNTISAAEDLYRSSGINHDLTNKQARSIYASFDKVATRLDAWSK